MSEQMDLILKILALIAPILGAIPGIIALSKINSEKRKTTAEARKGEADAAQQIESAALSLIKHHEEDTQRYKKIALDYECTMQELKKDFSGCKEQLSRFADELSKVLRENTELNKLNQELRDRIKNLESVVKALSEQLEALGLDPKYGKRTEDFNKEN